MEETANRRINANVYWVERHPNYDTRVRIFEFDDTSALARVTEVAKSDGRILGEDLGGTDIISDINMGYIQSKKDIEKWRETEAGYMRRIVQMNADNRVIRKRLNSLRNICLRLFS